MPRTASTTARRLLIPLALALMILTAGCTGGTADASEPETTSTPDKTLERSSANQNVYTDNTATTIVNYPGSMVKTIYWEDQTVCTKWESPQEGGVSCLPFNETQIDERYDPPATGN